MPNGLDVLMGTQAAAGPSNGLDVLMGGTAPPSLPEAPKGSGSTLVDAGNALGTGYFQGLTRLAGLPVDTVANVIDLGKAGLGSAYQAMTGKPAPNALQLTDRSQVIGSGDWLLNKAKQLPRTDGNRGLSDWGTSISPVGQALTQPINPDYQGGYMQAAGAGLTGVMGPQSGVQAANQALIGTTSALGGKGVMDATGSPALAIAASMLPMGAQQLATAGVKGVVRGGEQGRKQMEQRIQDLKNAGVDNPTLGLASGNKVVGGVENILQSTPGAVGIMGGARDTAVNALRGTTEDAANLASPDRGALESGVAIQNGIKGFKDQYKQTQAGLYGKLDQYIPGQTPVDVANAKQTLSQLNADIPGAPSLSKFFKNEKIQALDAAIKSDTGDLNLTPAQRALHATPLLDGATYQPLRSLPEPTDMLPFEAVKKTRTLVGNEIADNSLMSTVPQSKWRALYGGLSEDMGNAAQAAGPQAEQAFNRATDYTRAGAQRLERVAPFAQTAAPEQAYTALVNASKENVSTLQAVKKTLPPDARGTIAGTVIERLGRATNGVQNESGTAWSPETFLTNWNKMTPRARDELFSGFDNSPQVRQNVESVARAASMMRESSKMWANPSGTGANVAARATIAGLLGGGASSAAGLLNPMIPLGIGGGLLGTNLLARGLTSPTVVNAIARRTYMSPQMLNAQVNSLVAPGLLTQ